MPRYFWNDATGVPRRRLFTPLNYWREKNASVLAMLSATLTGAGFPADGGKRRKSSRFENYSGGVETGSGGGWGWGWRRGAPCTNRYTSVNDLEISPGSAREVPEICGICRRAFYLLLAYVMRQYIYDSRSCVGD